MKKISPSRPRFTFAPFGLITLVLASATVLIWFADLPPDARSAVIGALPLTLLLLFGCFLTWTLFASRERRLREEAMEYERDQIFSLSLDVLCVMTTDGHFRRTNPAFLNILGQRPDNLIEKSFTDIIHPDDMHLVLNEFKALALGRQRNFEVRCRCGDGTYKWLSWSANPTVQEETIYAVAHDISARKQVEDALRAETAFRKAMEESVSTGLQAIDMRGRIIYVNRAFCEMVALQPEALIGAEPPFRYWHDKYLQQHWQELALCLSGKAPKDGVYSHAQQPDGTSLDIQMQISPLVDAHGIQSGWMSAMTDVTESRRAREELEAAHERFIVVLDGLDAAVFVTDVQTDELLYANRAYLTYLANLDEASVGNATAPVQLLQNARAEPKDYLHDPRTLTIDQLPCELFDGELQHPETGHWYHLRERATRWVDGRIVCLVVATNVSDLKRVEELNREQEERLQRTSRLITMGEMASTLAHELNQPLSAIANYSNGCVNRLQSGNFKQEELLSVMEKASAQAARAGNIVRRVRDFVRKSEPKRAMITLNEVIEDAIGIAEIEAQRLGVRIQKKIENPLAEVYADRIMVEQVLLNLIKNAAESEENQPLERRVVKISTRQVAEMIEVAVTDNGYGISEETREKMFSAFFTTKEEGMGMGLNICRSIIEFHHGRLWVDPNPEGGSIFRFTLPTERDYEHQ